MNAFRVRAWLCAFCLGLAIVLPAEASIAGDSHGFAILGELKYPPGFEHFDYVNPDAPKGGHITLSFPGSFDSVNPFILKGVPAAGSNPFIAGGNILTFETLMVGAADEPDSYYGLVAESVALADDRQSVSFTLRLEARWHDGTPITAEDVVFSFNTLREDGYPIYRILYRDVVSAEALSPREVRFTFRDGANTRDLPGYVATMPLLSKAYYQTHTFNRTTLEPPLASGPYRIAAIDPGRSITYERVKDYWGADLPVNRGRHNFDSIRYDYYRDRDVALEAFFAGKVDFHEEFTSRDWATKYDGVPAVRDGRIRRDVLPDRSPSGTQAFFLNTRREKFQDPRVRQALNYAFDFEWTNKNLFYGLYERTTSIFENSDLAAKAPPTEAELALLEPFRDQVPPEVFTKPYRPPVTDGSGGARENLRAAAALLQEAGWTVRNGARTSARGEPLTIEFLSPTSSFERVIMPYIRNLQRLGIRGRFRLVESAQYQARLNDFDFDVVTVRFGGTMTPGVELRSRFGSAAADLKGSSNYAGIKNAAVDALIEKVIAATTRPELLTAAHALDRIVMWNHYLVPQWYKGTHHIAYWDIFGRPKVKPDFELGFLDTWWVDTDKAAALAR